MVRVEGSVESKVIIITVIINPGIDFSSGEVLRLLLGGDKMSQIEMDFHFTNNDANFH